MEKTDPRPLWTTLWCTHVLQSPAAGRFTRVSIARATVLAIAAAALGAGCGGDDAKSEEDRAADVAKTYVHAHSNKERENCAGTLATGVDPKLCGDLGPLVSRNNPEERQSKVTGNSAKVTVTGAGNNTRIDVTLVKQDGEWKVQRWRGYAVK